MSTYENEVKEQSANGEVDGKLNIGTLKYFWLSSSLSPRRKEGIPKFLRNIYVLKNFTDNELRILSKFLHRRVFSRDEVIFEEGDIGFGFYLVLKGHVEINVKNVLETENNSTILGHLERYDYFGELALLEDNSKRSATAVTKDETILLGIFKPDLDDLIDCYPRVAAKLLQSISLIVANRLSLVTNEMKILKEKLKRFDNGDS